MFWEGLCFPDQKNFSKRGPMALSCFLFLDVAVTPGTGSLFAIRRHSIWMMAEHKGSWVPDGKAS